MSFAEQLESRLRAGYQIMSVTTHEEMRCIREIAAVLQRGSGALPSYHLAGWDLIRGYWRADAWVRNEAARHESPERHIVPVKGDCTSPIEMIDLLLKDIMTSIQRNATENQLTILCDLHHFFNDPALLRQLRHLALNSLCNRVNAGRWPVILIQPTADLPYDIKHHVTPLEFNLPGMPELHSVFEVIYNSVNRGDTPSHPCSDDLRENICITGRGLTSAEFEDVLTLGLQKHKGFVPEITELVEDEKALLLKHATALEYVPKSKIESIDNFAGMEGYVDFVKTRAKAYSRAGKEVGLESPRGVVLVGVPGSGKSMVGMATARAISEVAGRSFPLVIMDVGALFGSLVGESEARTRAALQTVDAQGGAVLMLDEAEKAFGGAADATGDSGVTRRMFGQILSWLTRAENETFVIATMNRIDGIPPEFLRKGRFDEVFFVDVPDRDTRRKIFDIHLAKRGLSFESLGFNDQDVLTAVEKTNDWVGAEIETVVKDAMYLAFSARGVKQFNLDELLGVIEVTRPISAISPDEVNRIREFGKTKARPVTIAGASTVAASPQVRRAKRARSMDIDD